MWTLGPTRENEGYLLAFRVFLHHTKTYSDIDKINSYAFIKTNISEIKQIYHLFRRKGFQIFIKNNLTSSLHPKALGL